MCGIYFNQAAVSKVSEYHVHIYADAQGNNGWMAHMLAQKLIAAFPGQVSGGSHVGVVGPHSRPNVEVDIKPEAFGAVLQMLQLNSNGLSVLIHPRTDDEHFDHLSAALWLGEPVPFNMAFFDRLAQAQARPPRGPQPPKR